MLVFMNQMGFILEIACDSDTPTLGGPGCLYQSECADKPKMRDILQTNWTILFKIVKVMKDEERLRNYHRQEDTIKV